MPPTPRPAPPATPAERAAAESKKDADDAIAADRTPAGRRDTPRPRKEPENLVVVEQGVGPVGPVALPAHTRSNQRISDERAKGLDRGTLLAVGHDRGYPGYREAYTAGRTGVLEWFLKNQANDNNLVEEVKPEEVAAVEAKARAEAKRKELEDAVKRDEDRLKSLDEAKARQERQAKAAEARKAGDEEPPAPKSVGEAAKSVAAG